MKVFGRGYSKIKEESVPFAKDAERLKKEQKTAEAAKDKMPAAKTAKRSRKDYEKFTDLSDMNTNLSSAILYHGTRTYGTCN